MTEYLGGGWETAAMGISALKEEADEVQEEYGVGAKARGELAEYNYVVGVGVVKSEPPQPPYQKWWATAGTPAADVSTATADTMPSQLSDCDGMPSQSAAGGFGVSDSELLA